MARSGHDVLAFAPDHDDATRAWLRANGITPIDFSLARAGMNPVKDATSLLELRRLLRLYKPDITLGYYIKPVIYGTIAAFLLRKHVDFGTGRREQTDRHDQTDRYHAQPAM